MLVSANMNGNIDHRALAQEFHKQGFLVIPNACRLGNCHF